ncbi:hypothetical protein [Hyphomicrobium sp. ghe19]|uniref:hypothetical protein n=1 Tax=Hyphomicrobium sp. ghe19 TaxID=2682968 RepID=UPI001366999E|nr:hypothetical protein HYPP_01083 [Hyphomicrobium sp. ghe19]
MSLGRQKGLGSLIGAIAASMAFGSMVWGSTSWEAAAAEPPEDIVGTTRAAVATARLTPRDTGSRYGQALGASELCTGAKVTDKASALPALYADAELEEFKAQQKKIYDAWIRVKHCVREEDPNQCKVIIDESCAAALTEIGPKGTAFPGLLEFSRP